MARISDLILDSKLETSFLPDCTVHTFQESDPKSRQRLVTRSEHWHRQKKIGGGGFGTVWLETCTQGASSSTSAPAVTVRAVKQIDLDSRLGKIDYHRELEAIAKFSHARYERCFVKSFGWYEGPRQLFITMEYLEIGDLFTYLCEKPPLPEAEAKHITYQILDALTMMHQHEFAHRDLKPNNILIKSHPPDEWWIKLADFGITKRIDEGRGQSSTMKGTPRYFAPEIWEFVPRGSAYATDIWALGEIIFEMLTKRPAFGKPALLASYKSQNQFPTNILTNANVSQSGIDFVMSLMHPDPNQRITTTMAMSDVWIRSLVPCSSESPETIGHGEPQFLSPSVNTLAEEFASWNTRSPPHTQGPAYATPHLPRPDTAKGTQEPVTVAEQERMTSSPENTRPKVVQGQAETIEISAVELSDRFKNATSLLRSNHLEEAEAQLRWVCQAQEKVLHQDRLRQDRTKGISPLFALGQCVYLRGRHAEAETILDQALQAHEKALGPEHRYTLSCTQLLGLSIDRQGRFEEAETIFRQALQGREKVLGPFHKNTLNSLNCLGICLYCQGRYKEAEIAFRRSFGGRHNLLGLSHGDTVDSAFYLGKSLSCLARYKEAETVFRQIITYNESHINRPGPAFKSIYRVGLCLFNQENYEESEKWLRRALVARDLLGPTHKVTLDNAYKLAQSVYNQNRYIEAEALICQALRLLEEGLGHKDVLTLKCAYRLGHSLYLQYRYEEAEAAYRRALEGLEETLGGGHVLTLDTIFFLGQSVYRQNSFMEAEKLFQRALERQEKILGYSHEDTRLSRDCAENAHIAAVAAARDKIQRWLFVGEPPNSRRLRMWTD
ncbi:hypothetical protein PMG11_04548 [Penicillium brasilianum]|uniref:Protein kinase domain-containing protein n=1 Tax=Penicillium brasilianum TaxID=104259 RepID=A0A0F7VD18_PENBI|nr:hypothetical protein PMG11_04548 [Penicillium brasilianum]